MTIDNQDPVEIAKFSALAAHWWDPEGELKTLHAINPVRLHYINEKAPLTGKTVLDIGCGGGILAESMAAVGAKVTGIDMSTAALNAAKLHQKLSSSPLNIDYQEITAEQLAETHTAQFDIITCLECLEHVPDPASLIKAAARLVKPQGQLFFSTLNRNIKSYLFAILGAEYLLKLLPKNTHEFAQFIRPSELATWARKASLTVSDLIGLSYNPLTQKAKLTQDTAVNYIMLLEKTG